RDQSGRLRAAREPGARHGRPLGALVPGHPEGRAAVHGAPGRSGGRMRLRFGFALAALAAGAVAVVVAIFLVHDALADGDPASDYLISQQSFVSFKANFSDANVKRLGALLDDSKKKGFPLKVAVIAGRYDLGSVPSLYGKPQQYASFLGQEDFYFFK